MAVRTGTESRVERWERATAWVLTTVALLFLGAYAWPIIDPDLPPPWPTVCQAVTWGSWALFVGDYLARLWLAEDRRAFVRSRLPDLAVIVLPLLRPLRLLRLVLLLNVLNRHAGRSLRGQVVTYVVGATSLVMLVAALAVLDAERGRADGNIGTFGDALWWSFATVTTVGYGDRFPVSLTGRVVAAGLMLTGIALLGVITATFASWLIERVRQVSEEEETVTRLDLQALTAEITRLRAAVAELSSSPEGLGPARGRPGAGGSPP